MPLMAYEMSFTPVCKDGPYDRGDLMTDNHDTVVPRPLITIAITCYNAEDTIRRAVISAIRQTWSNREIIILDDFSTDGSWKVVQDLMQGCPGLRAIRHDCNRGVAAARNSLLAEARGQFIAFFDDDDESAIDRLERQYERIITYETAHISPPVFCYSNRNVVRVGQISASFQRFGIGRLPSEPHSSTVADYVLGLSKSPRYCWGMLGTCTLMARPDTIRTFGSFDDRFRRGAELDFAIRAALKGAHFISVDSPLITQYLTDTPDKADAITLKYRLLLLRKHKVYLDSKRAYWGTVANMRAGFHHTKGRHRRARVWRALALALFPWRISWERLTSRRHGAVVTAGKDGS